MRPIQIENCEHYSVTECGKVKNTNTGRQLKYDLSSGGYRRVTLWSSDQRRIRIAVHRLVAMTYLCNPDGKPMVNHKDGDKLNNHKNNLEWVTCKENTTHAFKEGLRKGPNRLPDNVVIGVKKDREAGILTASQIRQKYGLSRSRYSDINRYYKDLI